MSEGLEGQVTNQMALLFDNLTNPGADVGLFSQSALSWKRTGEAPIDHVVLGKGKVGGTWQVGGWVNVVRFGVGRWVDVEAWNIMLVVICTSREVC